MILLNKDEPETANISEQQKDAVLRYLTGEEPDHPLPLYYCTLIKPVILDWTDSGGKERYTPLDRDYLVKTITGAVRRSDSERLHQPGILRNLGECLHHGRRPGFTLLGNLTMILKRGWDGSTQSFFSVIPPLFMRWRETAPAEPETRSIRRQRGDSRLHDLLFLARSRLNLTISSPPGLEFISDNKMGWLKLYTSLADYLDGKLKDMTVNEWVRFSLERYVVFSTACVISFLIRDGVENISDWEKNKYREIIDTQIKDSEVPVPRPPELLE